MARAEPERPSGAGDRPPGPEAETSPSGPGGGEEAGPPAGAGPAETAASSPPSAKLYGDDERAAAFAAFLESHAGECQAVALQDYPDPDAIASGLAYRMMAAKHDIAVDILYEGRISHQENLALVHLLEIPMTRVMDDLPLDRYQGAVFIDNQGTTTRLTDRFADAGVPTLAIIDHHAEQSLLDASFRDIRAVGAAATILADYLRSGLVLELSPDDEEHARLATALVHALRSETNGMIRAGSAEYLAGAFLTPFLDTQLLEHVLRVQRPRGTMEVIRVALTDRIVNHGLSLAGVGYLRHADRDAVPQATDFLITEENVHTAIVYGILMGEGEREVVVGSARTSKVTLDVDTFLKSALGTDFRGRYYGGGRSGAGGFEIPIGFLEGASDPEQLKLKWDAFNRQIQAKLLKAAGVETEEENGG